MAAARWRERNRQNHPAAHAGRHLAVLPGALPPTRERICPLPRRAKPAAGEGWGGGLNQADATTDLPTFPEQSSFPYGEGCRVRPHTSLPDRPPTITTILSLPHDTLRANLCYPARDGIDDAILKRALEQVGLAQLQDQLDCEDAWGNRLSGGEQQRLSLARALIARPHILYLEEATNQLDDAAACRLMQTLKTALPDTLCLAISHQAAIKALFARQIDLNRYRAPAGLE